MNRNNRRQQKKYVQQRFSSKLIPIPIEQWPVSEDKTRTRVWASTKYMVQEFREPGKPLRLSINRAEIGPNGRWREDISWDELQAIKNLVGFAAFDAVEIYPRQSDVVNVANMRHLWVLSELLTFVWR